MPRLVSVEHVVEQAGSSGLGEELRTEADEPARRDDVVHAHPAGAVVHHLLHAALAQRHELGDNAEVVLRDVDRQSLHRLVLLAVDDLRDDLGLADGELEILTAHHLDEDRELKLAAALDLPGVGALGVVHANRDVADELLLETLLDHARGQLLAALAGQRCGVDADGHRDRRLVDGDDRQGHGVLDIGEGLADRDLRDTCHGDDVAGAGAVSGYAGEVLRDEQFDDLRALDGAVDLHPRDLLALLDVALMDTAEREPAEVRRGVEVRHVRLQRLLRVVLRGRDGLEEGLEQRLEVLLDGHPAVFGAGERGTTGLGARVDDREVDLLLIRIEIEEELVGLVDNGPDAGVGSVDLVDDKHDGEVLLQCLAQHETSLGQRALRRIDEEHDAIDHLEPALDLAAEVSVAGGVDDVEGHPAFWGSVAGVVDRGVLREDRDALLALEVHRVHDAVIDVLILTEGARLPEHGIDQGGLAVVDVSDDGDISKVFSKFHPVTLWRHRGLAEIL